MHIRVYENTKRFLCLLFFSVIALSSNSKNNELDSIFAELDNVMANKAVYLEQKEKDIAELKKMLDIPNITDVQKFDIYSKIHNEYYYYTPDSAKAYLLKNLKLVESFEDRKTLMVSLNLSLVSMYSTEGLYIEAINLLDSIRPYAEEVNMLGQYFARYKQLFYFYSAQYNSLPQEYFDYQDSLIRVTGKNANPLLIAEKLTDEGNVEKAREIIIPYYNETENGTHKRAMVANSMGRTYVKDKDYENQKKYFAIAAINDMKSSVREHESFRSLAIACFETNNIDRAYRYISQSMEDALTTRFNMRMVEASQFFPIIEKAYQSKVEAEKNKFRLLSAFTGIIAIFLIIGIVYIYKQMKKIDMIRKSLKDTNKQLKTINEDIGQINIELSEANLLKETYITEFLNVCSLYVKKIEKFQNTLNKKIMERKFEELSSMLKSRDLIETELKELLGLFDQVFLKLYPDFIDEINKLLPLQEQFVLKNTNAMNTELRIFALIRLGITDSNAIAEFLHYSIKTIYNYRTRLRNKAIIPAEDFENRIKQIGRK
ncbi:hypothetical protein M2138_001763 [Dysgonomonadaceae bacterium PH5-43]|nr:hypothetical protein [Dysgonomonadaceae bacterium PH5-43]